VKQVSEDDGAVVLTGVRVQSGTVLTGVHVQSGTVLIGVLV